jgi:hypothetical protein
MLPAVLRQTFARSVPLIHGADETLRASALLLPKTAELRESALKTRLGRGDGETLPLRSFKDIPVPGRAYETEF